MDDIPIVAEADMGALSDRDDMDSQEIAKALLMTIQMSKSQPWRIDQLKSIKIGINQKNRFKLVHTI